MASSKRLQRKAPMSSATADEVRHKVRKECMRRVREARQEVLWSRRQGRESESEIRELFQGILEQVQEDVADELDLDLSSYFSSASAASGANFGTAEPVLEPHPSDDEALLPEPEPSRVLNGGAGGRAGWEALLLGGESVGFGSGSSEGAKRSPGQGAAPSGRRQRARPVAEDDDGFLAEMSGEAYEELMQAMESALYQSQVSEDEFERAMDEAELRSVVDSLSDISFRDAGSAGAHDPGDPEVLCPLCRRTFLRQHRGAISCPRDGFRLDVSMEGLTLSDLRDRLAVGFEAHALSGCIERPKFTVDALAGVQTLRMHCAACELLQIVM